MNMEKKSVWSKYLKDNEFKSEETDFDVLIIGGSLSGILVAYELRNSNLKVGILERNKILDGITSKMTAKLTLMQDILTKIEDNKLDTYLKSQIDGLNILKSNILESKIECDFKDNISYLFTTKISNIKKIKKIKTYLDKYIKTEVSNLEIDNLDIKYAIKTSNSYEINPIKYLNKIVNLLNNTTIYENTNVIEVIKEDGIFTVKVKDNREFKSKRIVFATNYPYFLKPLLFPIKVRLEKSYIGYGSTNLKLNKNINAINIDKDKYSFRFYKGKMIYLTGSRMIASKVNDSRGFDKVINSNYLTNIDNLWSNMDIITNDYLPIVGELVKDMYILTGYNTWGLLSSHISASIIASLIMKKKKYLKYKELFKPRRKLTLKKFMNSSLNIYESMNGYIKGIITKNKIIFYSKKEAMYIDKNGKYYVVKRKCPHLKCNLIFNSVEHTWDCPCHGSRFDLEGNLISGPSKDNIKIEKDVK